VQNNISKRKVVVIVGAGFGGLNAAINLRRSQVDVILVDRNNYHLFQPLLYQVATAGLAPEEIAYPVRSIFRSHSNATFRLAVVTGIDLDGKCLHTSNGVIPYDFLILSVGGETNFFGLKNVKKNGFELKDLDDAESIRNHILRMFEMASFETDEELRQAMRTFVVVGGGPTGVECVGALSELVRLVLVKDFPKLKATDVRIILMEMMDHLLPGFPDQLSEAAIRTLKRKKVEVRLSTTVNDFDGEQVTLESGEVIRAKTLVWAAGVRAASIIDKSGLKTAKQNRVVVEPTLQAPGHPEVFVIGDAAYLEHDGAPLPMVAPVAIQQAKTAAKNINNLLSNKPLEEFGYKDPGSLATIGRNNAVARVGRFKFHGFIAWLIWLVVHLFWLIGFRNRMLVLINWAWDYFLYERAVRLITPPPKR
jgi:NADH:ubiquinone reductase (H+-translocating)